MDRWENRPFSWSQMASFEYDPEQWYRRYVLDQKDPETAEMAFGKQIGETLASDETFLTEVPRHPIYEKELHAHYKNIEVVGFIDAYDPDIPSMLEYKTGQRAWTQQRVDTHGQLDMYAFMLYLTESVNPDNLAMRLVWIPTQKNNDFSISMTGQSPVVFHTSRSMKDIIQFGVRIENTINDMRRYIKTHH